MPAITELVLVICISHTGSELYIECTHAFKCKDQGAADLMGDCCVTKAPLPGRLPGMRDTHTPTTIPVLYNYVHVEYVLPWLYLNVTHT